MFRIKRLYLENYTSYKQATIEFPPTGLFFIKGINYDNGENSAIESGKTFLLESIAFCLFGRTIRNLTLADYIRWGESNFYLELELYNGMKVSRTIDSLEVILPDGKIISSDKKTAVQNAINTELAIDFKTFFFSVYTGYLFPSFVTLTPSERLNLFTALFSLSILDNCSKFATKEANKLFQMVDKYDLDISYIEGQIKELSNSYESDIVKWEKERDLQIASLQKQREELKDRIKELRKLRADKVTQASLLISRDRKDFNQLRVEKEKIELEIVELESEIKNLKFLREHKRKEIEELRAVLSKFDKGKCPTCLQPITDSAQFVNSLKKRIEKAEKDYSGYKEKIKETEIDLLKAKNKLHQVNSFIEKSLKRKELVLQYESDIKRLEYYINDLEQKLKNIEKDIKELKSKENPYERLEKTRKKKLESLQKSLHQKIEKKNLVKEKAEVYQFWINGFKSVKANMFNSLKESFENLFNSYLKLLGSNNTIRLVKEGEKLDFEFYINGNPSKLDSFSGGGKQILRLACFFALSTLLKNKISGKFPEFFILDEPMVNLSIKERKLVMDYLYSLKDNKQIFLVDHALDINDSNFDKVFVIEKRKGVSNVREIR